jgi:hypothetical protein
VEPLAEPGELNTHLQREIEPDRAEQAVQLASGAVRAYCGWNLSLTTETLQTAGNGTIVLTLPTLSLIDVIAVSVNGLQVPVGAPSMSWTRRGQLIRLAGWPSLSTVDVDCTHGYAEIPDVVKLVVLELAGRALNASPEGLKRATVGAVTKEWATAAGGGGLTDLDQRLLDRYSI